MSSKRTAIVTGASRGIGAALVEALVTAGDNVVATSRSVNQSLAASPNLVPVAGDIGKKETAAKVVVAAAPVYTTEHFRVNCHGPNGSAPIDAGSITPAPNRPIY
jgi:NAD(P)-dependent dehydrogenase (short-subunit alcohol dehydrogenase family)